jgi:hypothetical protein
MNCDEVELLVEAIHDNESDLLVKTRVERHLANCPYCSEIVKGLQNLRGTIQKGLIPLPSPSLNQRVMCEIKAAQGLTHQRKSRWRLILNGSVNIPKPAFAAALLIFAACLVLSYLQGRNAANSFVPSEPKSLSSPYPVFPSTQEEPEEKTMITDMQVNNGRKVTGAIYTARPRFDSQGGSHPNEPRLKTPEKNSLVFAQNIPDMKDSMAETGYFTRVNLSGFRPITDAKTRIIKGSKADEK